MVTGRDGPNALLAFSRASVWSAALNTAVGVLICRGLFHTAASDAGVLALGFAHLAALAQVALVALVVGSVATVTARLSGSTLLAAAIAAIGFSGLQVFLVIDRIVYEMFHFHINALAYNVLTTPGGFASLRLSAMDKGLFLGAITVLPVVEYLLLAFLTARLVRRPTPAHTLWRPWFAPCAVVLLAGAAERTIYAASDLRGDATITNMARLVPFYQPTTVKRLARRLGVADTERGGASANAMESSSLRYPRQPLVAECPASRPNILWIVLDSWRHDSFTPEVTPNIARFAEAATVFESHMATGNATRFGIFGMLYGMHGAYWHRILAERRGPVLVTRLRELGYEFRIIAPSPLTFPEFRHTAFVDVQDAVVDRLPGATLLDRHAAAADAFENFVAHERQEPFFAFVFFDASHAPYDFPSDHAHFRPYAESVSYATMSWRSDGEEIRNRYKNSLRYLDSLSQRLLVALTRAGMDERTIVLITGDHGEEFGEHGFWGHNSAFTPEQIHVPLAIRFPNRKSEMVSRRTSHLDLVPTFMELLGVRNAALDYSNGESLFVQERSAKTVSCGWDDCAWVLDDAYVVFGTASNWRWGLEVLDGSYRTHPNGDRVLARKGADLAALAQEFSTFLDR